MGSPKVIRTGEPELIPDIPDEILRRPPPTRSSCGCCAELGIRSSMVVPLRVRGTVIGDIALVARRVRPPVRRERPARRPGARRPLRAVRSTTRASTRCARPRAMSCRRSSRASPTPSPPRPPTAGSSTRTRPPSACSGSPAPRRCSPPHRRARASYEMLTEDGQPLTSTAAGPARAARRGAGADDRPLPVPRRGGGPLVAHPGDPGPRCAGGVRLAINVIEDITELKRAERAAALPGRGEPRARRLARLRGDAAHGRPAGGAGDRRLVRGRRARGRRRRCASRSRTWIPRASSWRARCASATRSTRDAARRPRRARARAAEL